MNKNRYYDPFENINSDDINAQKKSKVLSSKSVNSSCNQRVYLYRIDNNEKIAISKPSFIIGKNGICDYVIHGNNAISRQHAEINLKNNNDVYIIDKKSTNKTFVNGREIEPGKLVSIVNGDEIKFANVRLKLIIE